MKLNGLLKSLVPEPLKKQIKRRMRGQRLDRIRRIEVPIALSDFEKALYNLGVEAGQVLFVHSGADWLRTVEGGPMKVLELIRNILGDEGTLAMPSFPFTGLASEYVATEIFDVRRSPSKMGLLTELFRRLPGVNRSLHPTHPVCALGKMASHLTNSHHLDSHPFGIYSPFARIEEEGGLIIMIGVNSDFLTHVHVVEDQMGNSFSFEVYLQDPIEVSVINKEGETVNLTTLVHNPYISRQKSISRHERDWQKVGVLRCITLGHIELRAIDAKRLSEHLKFNAQKGKTIYE